LLLRDRNATLCAACAEVRVGCLGRYRNDEPLNQLLAGTTANIVAWGGDSAGAQTGALRQLWLLTLREAQTLAFSDVFLVIMACFILATAMVPLMRKVQPPKAPSADSH
jgi:DHA2 family multidrug resistance protein